MRQDEIDHQDSLLSHGRTHSQQERISISSWVVVIVLLFTFDDNDNDNGDDDNSTMLPLIQINRTQCFGLNIGGIKLFHFERPLVPGFAVTCIGVPKPFTRLNCFMRFFF